MTQEKDLDEQTFDQFAETLGVDFSHGGVRVPYGMNNDIFKLLMLHYVEKSLMLSNFGCLLKLLQEQADECETIEDIQNLLEYFVSIHNSQLNTEPKIIPIEEKV